MASDSEPAEVDYSDPDLIPGPHYPYTAEDIRLWLGVDTDGER